MSVESKVKINTHYTRSVHLERDADSKGVVEAYIPTSRALSTLSRISETFNEKDVPRAWALVGPYGSGKSSFAVFLSHLLGSSSDPIQKLANKVLKQTDDNIAKKYTSEVRNKEGYCNVLLTGSPEPLAKRFVESLYNAAVEFWSTKRGRAPAIITKLEKISRKKEPKISDILSCIEELQDQVAKSNGKGVLVILDEFGKFLEYEARHTDGNDIFLLQALAEHGCAGHKANLYIFVLLHQAFDQYAKGLGESLKNEWSKVQGRFENIPFLESAEQVLRIVSAAFNNEFSSKEEKTISEYVKQVSATLYKESALPNTMDEKMAIELFSQCYPLHPISALLLPILCQKVAQNERTLFSYLGSQETHGFKDSLSRLNKVGDWIYPWEIYDYFILNQPAALADNYTHRRWAEVVTAIERLGDAPDEQIQILKTIGLLNIIGAQGGFKASKGLLNLCLPNDKDIKSSINGLLDESVIQYRKFSSEYRVWQGSDFDIEEAIATELVQLGHIELAKELNKRSSLVPIVARKYTIQKGTLRYFQPIFVDAQSYQNEPEQDKDSRIIFHLSNTKDKKNFFEKEVVPHFSALDVVVNCQKGSQLQQVVEEILALQRVRTNRQELNADPIAQREFSDRLGTAEVQESILLNGLNEYPEEHIWYWDGNPFRVKNKRDLQNHLTEVLEAVYNKCPIIKNELINRTTPSAQANAARNKLLFAMMQHEGKEELGIDNYPPEKSIYRAVLKATNLHKKNENDEWQFVEPKQGSKLYPVWKVINDYLDGTEKQAKSFIDLNEKLKAPPYGIKSGVLPIIYIAFYQVYQHELALYENKHYRPYFDEIMLERFVKRPDQFTFQRFRIEGLKASIFKQYSKVIHGDTKQRTMLELAKPLASFMGCLPEYTQSTRRGLSKKALAVRSAFNLSKSPEQLLFIELPKAIGFSELNEKSNTTELEEFAVVLTETLRILKVAYDEMLDKQTQLLSQAFNLSSKYSLSKVRSMITGNCLGLENYTVDTQGLCAFIKRLTKTTGTDDEWFENVLMFLGSKPTKKWLDSDQDAAEHRLSDLSRRVIDLEKLRLHEKDCAAKTEGDFDVYLLRSIKKGGDFVDEVVVVDEQRKKHIESVKYKINDYLSKLSNDELVLATLAETVDEFLVKYHKSQLSTKAKKTTKNSKKPKIIKGNLA